MRKRATVDVNQRAGTTAVRLNGMIEDGGVAGRDIAEANARGLAPSIAFGLGTRTRAIFSYEHLERDDVPDWGVPAAMIKEMVNYNPIAARAGRDNFYGLNSDFDRVSTDSVLARFEHDLAPGITISNQTRWSQVDREARYMIPTGFANPNVTTQRQFYDRVNSSISNQTNLAGTFIVGGLKHVISTGVEFTREESEANRFGTQNPGNTNVFDPDPGRFNAASLSPTQRNAIAIDTAAVYFYDTIHLNRQWPAGGRTPPRALQRLDRQQDDRGRTRRREAAKGDYGPSPGFPGATTTNGDELAFTPNFFANLWLTHALTDKLTVGGGVRYVGESWLGRPDDALRIIPNGKFGKLPDYFVVNLMASYELTKNIDLRFNIDNVFDETYAVSTNWPGTRVFLGEPRTFRIGTAFKY